MRRTLWALLAAAGLLLAIAASADAQTNPARGSGKVDGRVEGIQVGTGPKAKDIRRRRARKRQQLNPDEQQQKEPADPADRPSKPTSPQIGDATSPMGSLRAAAIADDQITIFRESVTEDDDTSDVSEPTIANIKSRALATGNWYTAISADEISTWDSLNPFANPANDAGFCCDQYAIPIENGDETSIVWLRQYLYDAGDRENVLRFTVFKDGDDLLDGVGSCQFGLRPQVNFDLKEGYWFDYNRLGKSNDFLYVTTNVRDADKDDKRVGSLIFRIPRSDLDGDGCDIDFRYWYEQGETYIAPLQNGGDNMHLATHKHDLIEGDQLRIYRVADSSSTLDHKDKDIENFARRDGSRVCTLPNGDNPCTRLHSDRLTGFRSGNTQGWLWTAGNDSEFDFPHVRVAVFDTTDKIDKILEHQIWNADFAWTLPTVTVNGRGDVGVTVYAMGGGRNPKAQAFIRTDPRNWSGIDMFSIEDSTAGTPDWGDYANLEPYDGCPNTFLGMVWTMKGSKSENRAVWFGDADEGCPDLIVSALLALPATLKRGEDISMVQTTKNIGSGTAGASTTRYYLSRDAAKGGGDLLLGVSSPVVSLGRDGSQTTPAVTATIPQTASGSYNLLACADDFKVVDEIDEDNNCFTAQTITIESGLAAAQVNVNNIDLTDKTKVTGPNQPVKVNTTLHFPAKQTKSVDITYYVNSKPQLASGSGATASAVKRIGRFRVRGRGGPTGKLVKVRHRLRMPKRVSGRRVHLVACVGSSRASARCFPSRRRLYFRPR